MVNIAFRDMLTSHPETGHLIVVRDGARYICRLNDDLSVNTHRTQCECIMFRLVAKNVSLCAVGVILTERRSPALNP